MTEHNEPSLGPPREVSTSPPLDDRFWQATPAVGNHVVWERVGSGIAMWGVGTSFTINMVGSALVEHMDGSASLRELAEDLAMAGDIPEPTARHVVATLVHELTTRHALDDAPTRPAGISRSLGGDRTMGDSELHSGLTVTNDSPVLRGQDADSKMRTTIVEGPNGGQVTTDYYADGSRRVSTTLNIASTDHDRIPRSLLDGRSPAELVPPESCLGMKLRLAEPATVVEVPFVDRSISVRCTDPVFVRELELTFEGARSRSAGGRNHGSVEAFVVPPLEGDGPLRIFDGRGRRRGRPRSRHEALAIVDQILAERVHAIEPDSVPYDVPVAARILGTPDGGSFLVPPGILGRRHILAEFRRLGLWVSWTNAELTETLEAIVPTLRSTSAKPLRIHGVLLGEGDENADVDRARIAVELLAVLQWSDVDSRRRALRRVSGLLDGVEVIRMPLEPQSDIGVSLARISSYVRD